MIQIDTQSDPLNRIDSDQLTDAIRRFGLPLHLYFPDRVRKNLDRFRKTAESLYPNTQICFAIKANPCRGAVKLVRNLRIGVDTVSEFELQAALEEGISGEQIVCNGNAKSDSYLQMAIDAGALVVLDDISEVSVLARITKKTGKNVKTLVRIAGMPLEGYTAADQSTATSWTKFGTAPNGISEILSEIDRHDQVRFAGISAHIGTQICDAAGYNALMGFLLNISSEITSSGREIEYIDVGGGFPVSYLSESDWEHFQFRLRKQLGSNSQGECVTWDNMKMGYSDGGDAWRGKAYWSAQPGAKMLENLLSYSSRDGKTVSESLLDLGRPTLIIEPGRSLFGTAGITVAEVTGLKQVQGNNLVTLNLGIVNHGTNLITPDIFPMEIWPRSKSDEPVEAFLAGRLCFTGDMIAKVKVPLNRLPSRGELLIIHHTGAYSADHFASNSCGFPLPAKVAVIKPCSFEVWREEGSFSSVFPSI